MFYFSPLPNALWHVDPLLGKDAKEAAIQKPLLSNSFTKKHVSMAPSHVYCNFQKKYNLRFNIIAGIINLKHAFWSTLILAFPLSFFLPLDSQQV
jgi:hypothetical protein